MPREIDFLDSFVKLLKTNGYPENSLNIEPSIVGFGKNLKPDLVIVDPDSNKPLAIFELKRLPSEEHLNGAIQQLKHYSKAMKNVEIPLFAVFIPSNENVSDSDFKIFKIFSELNFYERDFEELKKIPDYTLLKNSQLTKEITKVAEEQEQTIDYFQMLCWVGAIFVFLIFLAAIFKLFTVDLQILALIGVIVGLFILPYANKLKILGFEFERLTDIKKGKSEKK